MSPSRGYHAVVLAAGAGSRFGGSKLTAPYNGGVLLDAALQVVCAAPVESAVVITGAHEQAVQSAILAFARESRIPIRSLRCADHASGMSASLRCGLDSLPADAAGAFIFLGDMPRIPHSVPGRLLGAVLAGALAAVPVFDTRWGHPVLISRSLFDSFSSGGGDGGGRAKLRGLGSDLALVEVDDDGVLADADTVADLETLRRDLSGSGVKRLS